MLNEGDRLSINKNEYLPGVCMLKLDDIYRDYNNTVIVAYRLMIYIIKLKLKISHICVSPGCNNEFHVNKPRIYCHLLSL